MGGVLEYAFPSIPCIVVVLLLLIDVSNLEPNVHLAERMRRISQDLVKTFERLLVALKLLVNDAEPEINLIRLFEIGIHMKDARKGFFGMLEGAIAVVEDADAIPQLCVFLWMREMEEGVLIGLIGRLEFVLHKEAMAERAPDVTILVINLNCAIEILDGTWIILSTTANVGGRRERSPRSWVNSQSAFICLLCTFEIAHRLAGAADCEPDALGGINLALENIGERERRGRGRASGWWWRHDDGMGSTTMTTRTMTKRKRKKKRKKEKRRGSEASSGEDKGRVVAADEEEIGRAHV